MKPRVLAIAGRALAGKDTFASFFPEDHYSRIALADNLKSMCQLVFGLSPWQTNTQEGKMLDLDPVITIDETALWKIINYMQITHPDIKHLDESYLYRVERFLPRKITTVRQLLQFVGTEICRTFVDSYHVDILIKKISGPQSIDRTWIVTDCRFPDERKAFRDRADAKIVLIQRPSADAIVSTHASETGLGALDEYDFVIQNDGTIESLGTKANHVQTALSFQKRRREG